MADRCDHCGVRMDGLEVHLDPTTDMVQRLSAEHQGLPQTIADSGTGAPSARISFRTRDFYLKRIP